MSQEKNIYLINDGEPITALWDGKEYELGKEPVEVRRGVAEHWISVHGEQLRIEELPAEIIEQRKPSNPLEDNNRGQAFAGLKNAQPSKEEAAALREKAKGLGIKNAHNMKIENLQAAIAEAEKLAEQEPKGDD